MQKLISETVEWASERGIFDKGTSAGQFEKFIEEAGEVGSALIDNSRERLVDGIGDTLVTIIILAEMNGLDVEGCLATALAEIKDRKGKMVGGVFVKETS